MKAQMENIGYGVPASDIQGLRVTIGAKTRRELTVSFSCRELGYRVYQTHLPQGIKISNVNNFYLFARQK